MGVGVDETGHDDAAPGVHELRLGIPGPEIRGGAHRHDLSAVGDDAAVGVIAGPLGVPGDDLAVCQKNHGKNLLRIFQPAIKKASQTTAGLKHPSSQQRTIGVSPCAQHFVAAISPCLLSLLYRICRQISIRVPSKFLGANLSILP
jgi:hypothetical protein